MYKMLIENIEKRVSDLSKFTDDSYANHHQVRGRYMEAQEIRNWLIASEAADAKTAADAKAAKPKKGSAKAAPVKATPKGKAKAVPAPSNVTPMPAKAKNG